jgi:WD40 repeat protein
VRSFQGHDGDINDVAFSPDGEMMTTTGEDGAARVWDPQTGEELWTLQGGGDTWGPSFSPDGSQLAATWPDEGLVRVMDLATGRTVREIRAVEGAWDTHFSPDGERLAVSSGNQPLAIVVDVDSGAKLFSLEGHVWQIMGIAWSPDGSWIATASGDSTVRIWNAATGQLRFTLFGHAGDVTAVDWSPDSAHVVSGGADGTARLWEVTDGGTRELLSLSAQDTRNGVPGVAFSPDGDRVMAGNLDVTAVKVWDVSIRGDAEWTNLPGATLYTTAAFTPDGRQVVANSEAGSVTVWNPETGKRLHTIGTPNLSAHPAFVDVSEIEISPDGQLVATSSEFSGPPRVWDLATGDEVFSVRPGQWDRIVGLDWNPDGDRLAVAGTLTSGESIVTIVDRSGRQVVPVLPEEPDAGFRSVDFSPDGRLLATSREPVAGAFDTEILGVKVWDWERGEVVTTIKAGGPVAVVFDPRGGRIATTRWTESLADVWDVESGQKLATFAGHSGYLWPEVAFSPDGSAVATGSTDGTVRLWDVESGAQDVVLRGHKGPVGAVAFSPDGTKLASVSGDGTVRVWAIALDDLIEIAEDDLTRRLTDEECRQYLHVDRCPQS